jgi:hypothetical protein
MMKTLSALFLGVCLTLFSASLLAQDVYYSNNSDHQSEEAAAAAELAAAIGGGTAVGFNAGSDAGWATALANAAVILSWQGSDVDNVASGTIDDIDNWVNSGGVWIGFWTQDNLDVINDLLGSSLVRGGTKSTGSFTATKTPATSGTSYADAPASLQSGSNHGWVVPASVPPQLEAMYVDESGDAHVLAGTYGSGILAYYSFDWCCSISGQGRDDWDSALLAAVNFAGVKEIPPVAAMAMLALLIGTGVLRRRHYV